MPASPATAHVHGANHTACRSTALCQPCVPPLAKTARVCRTRHVPGQGLLYQVLQLCNTVAQLRQLLRVLLLLLRQLLRMLLLLLRQLLPVQRIQHCQHVMCCCRHVIHDAARNKAPQHLLPHGFNIVAFWLLFDCLIDC